MENIIVKSGAGYTSGSFLYLEQNITFTLKGTDYCDISDLVILLLLINKHFIIVRICSILYRNR